MSLVQVLESLARWPGEAVRRRFFQLRVMDYLVRELSTEMDMAQGTPLQGGLPTGRSSCSSALPTPATLQVLLYHNYNDILETTTLACHAPATIKEMPWLPERIRRMTQMLTADPSHVNP